jgi:hypothetical protein
VLSFAGLFETLSSGMRRGPINIKDGNASTFLCKPPGGREPNAARRSRTRNDCRLAAKQHLSLPV